MKKDQEKKQQYSNILESPKFLAFFKTLFFGVES